MNRVYLLFEFEHNDGCLDKDVIGVISNPDNYKTIFDKYFGVGNWTEKKFRDIRDSCLEWERSIEVKYENSSVNYTITCEWFLVDDLF